MTKIDSDETFRGLPLSEEQEAEVQHYISRQRRRGLPFDTAELHSMIKDMLNPPCLEGVGADSDADNFRMNSERAASATDEGTDSISAAEELNASTESEAMKHPQR
jgi:hypothetical protein